MRHREGNRTFDKYETIRCATTHGELTGQWAERVDASTDPTPDLGNASGGIDVTEPHFAHATTHPFAKDFFDACVFVGGNAPHPFVAPVVQQCSLVVAADSGWTHARSVGVTPHVLVGDFDSISAEDLANARSLNIKLFEHPSNKDFTDAELAIDIVCNSTSTTLLFVSGGGDRLDHITSILHVLTDTKLASLKVCAIIGDTRVDFVTAKHQLTATCEFGDIVSLLPIGGPTSGVSTQGLRWSLDNEKLLATSSRGISNVAIESYFSVSITDGALAVIRPHYFPRIQEKTQ